MQKSKYLENIKKKKHNRESHSPLKTESHFNYNYEVLKNKNNH